MSVKSIPCRAPLLYSNNGVCRGILIFLISDSKHRLRVFVRTAWRVPTIYVLSENKIPFLLLNIFDFMLKMLLYIIWTC